MDSDWLKKGASGAGFSWHGPAKPLTGRAIVDNQQKLKQIWYLEQAAVVSRSVGRVLFADGKHFATCFLVAPNLVMTNHHVFGKVEDVQGVKIQFNYRFAYGGELETPDEYSCDPAVFITDEELDYSLVGLTKKAKAKWSYLPMRHGQVAAQSSHIAIIQHPDGEPLQVAMRDNSVMYEDDKTIEYLTNTEYGSSGSPVFNDNLALVALHSQRVQDPSKKDQKVWYRNRGIKIGAILQNKAVDKLIPQ